MRRAILLALAISTGSCGGKAKVDPPATATTPGGTLIVLEGLWADPTYTLSFRGKRYLLQERLPCALLPCASARTRTGTWTHDGTALHLASATYDVSVEDGGEILVLAPVAVAADLQATLRLRRQHLPPLAGTTWIAGEETFSFTETAYTRGEVTGTWKLEDGELSLASEGAEESFAVLYEHATLMLIGPTQTLSLRPAP